MPYKRKASDPLHIYQEFVDQLREANGYSVDNAFRDWAFTEVLAQYPDVATRTDELTAIDGSGDLGIDGWYADDEEKVIYLFQSRWSEESAILEESEILDFEAGLQRLTDDELVLTKGNPEAQMLARRLCRKPAYLEKGYTVHMIFVTTKRLLPELARKWHGAPRTHSLIVRGVARQFQLVLQVFDREGLRVLTEEHLSAETERPIVDLPLERISQRYQDTYIDDNGKERKILVAKMPAKDLVEIYEKHGGAVLQRNPRGALNTRINKEIVDQTLRHPDERHKLHLLNNGLRVTCDDIQSATANVLRITNFQIVNGCQTTVTLARNKSLIDDRTFLYVQIVEANSDLGNEIARTTNRQNGLKPIDYRSRDALQKRLRRLFQPLGYFYRLKRGVTEKKPRKLRQLDLRIVAQARLAFMGYPSAALDKVGSIISGETSDPVAYERIFGTATDHVTAESLLLAAVVAERVGKRYSGQQSTTQLPKYSKWHCVWLIGRLIALANEVQAPEFDKATSRFLYESVDKWFNNAFLVATRCLKASLQDAGKEFKKDHPSEEPDPREFFRNAQNYELIKTNLPDAVNFGQEFAAERGTDILAPMKVSSLATNTS